MGKRPRIPTWVLAILAVGAIAVAAWLFLTPGDGDDASSPKQRTDTSSHADSSLQVPNDETTTTDDSRRSEEGRTSLDPNDEGTTSTETTPGSDAELSPAFDTLRDASVAIDPTWSLASADTSKVRLGGLRVRCRPASTSEPVSSSVGEQLRGVLEQAGGSGLVAEAKEDTCADDRAAVRESSDAGVVLLVGEGTKPRVLPALAGAGTHTTDHDATLQLAREVAANIGAATPTDTPSKADRTLLLDAGVVDLPGGSSSVLVILPATDSATLAHDIAKGIAVTLAAQRD